MPRSTASDSSGASLSGQQAVNQAKRELYELDDPGLCDDVLVVDFGTGTVVLEGRGDDPEKDRQRMRRVIASVTLA